MQWWFTLKIEQARKRNPRLRGHIKRDGQTVIYRLLMHGGYFKTLEEKKYAHFLQKSIKTPWWPWMQLSNILATLICCFCVFSQCAWSVFDRLHSKGTPNDSTNEAIADHYLARIFPGELKCCLAWFNLVLNAPFPSKLLKWISNL